MRFTCTFIWDEYFTRYANQDEEDLALAMEALGHVKAGSRRRAEEKEAIEAQQRAELQKKQDKVVMRKDFGL